MNRHTGLSRLLASLTVAALLLLGSSPVWAASISWQPDADGFWDVAANWGGVLPGATDFVTIDVGGAVVRTITHRTGTTTIQGIRNFELVDVTSGSTLQLSGGFSSVNQGTLQANNGTINLIGSFFDNTGTLAGTLSAINGGRINLSGGASVLGGVFSTASGGAITTAVGSTATLTNVTLATGAQFIANNASSTTLNVGTITNNGTITLSSSGNPTNLILNGENVTFAGTGVVSMGNNINNRILGSGAQRLINSAGHTIQGAGQIGVNLTAITNAGLIVANQPTILQIDPNAAGVTNTGTLRAASGGTLELTGNGGGGFDNSSGTIEAQTGSTVRLVNGAVITGGNLTTSGTGVIKTLSGHTGTLSGVTITTGSQFVGDNSSSTVLVGTITNNGTIALNSSGNPTDLILSGNVTLAGSGAVTMSNNINNRIYGDLGTERLTITSGQTIQGAGQIGANLMALNNAGLIVANQSNVLAVNPLDGAGNMINTGTLRADGGTLQLAGGSYTNTGGTIEARDGSTVQLLNGAAISGGTLTTVGSGVITTPGGQTSTLNGVTLSTGSQFVGANSSDTILTGTITNNGTIALNSTGNPTNLILSGDVTLAGSGLVTMSNNINNSIYGDLGTERLTITSGQTIQGSGRIGANQTAITNAGLIVANQTNELLIDPSAGGVLNTGTLRATNNATLQLSNGAFDNTLGTIEAQNGSRVELRSNAVITGGVLATAGTGVINTPGGYNSTLDGVTISGGSQFVGSNSSTTILTGTIANNGTMSLASVGNPTDFLISGDVTLAGSGVVSLSNNGQNRIFGFTQLGTERLTVSAGHTIQGSGQIGAGRLLMTNEGLIVATQSNPLLMQMLDGAGSMINTGTLRADGGTLQLAGGTYTNAGGTIEALNGSVVELHATVVGGTLSTDATGVISASNGATLRDLTNVADFRVVNGSAILFAGTITNNRSILMNSIGNDTDITLSGDVTLVGAGTLALSNTTHNRIYGGFTRNEVLTNTAGHTIRGAGQIGIGQMGLNNQGLIVADQSNTLTIATAVGATSINTGTLRAAGGQLTISTTTLDNAGGLIEAVGSNVLLQNSTIVGGTLTSSGGGQIQMTSSLLENLTNAGQVVMLNGSGNQLRGTITNNGTLLMNSVGNPTQLALSGDATLTGPGTLTLSNNLNNRIIGLQTTDVLTNAAGHTIQGAGQLGIGTNVMGLNNQGLILANQSNGLVISLGDVATTARVNTGILRAAGGQLTIQFTALDNAGGLIDAAGSNVLLSGSTTTISGGTLQSSGGGEIQMQSSATLANLTNTGQVRMLNGQTTFLQGAITNNGAMLLASVGNETNLRINGNVTLAGTGTLTLSNTTANRIFGVASTDVLTNAAGHTIQGGGQLGVDLMGLNNQGLILANQSTALTINTSGAIVNSGTLQANNVLTLADAVNNSGTILANGGTVNAQAGFTGSTGTARLEGTGSIVVGAPSSVGNLIHNGTGALALGANSITVNTDYNNANFGIGNTFNARTNVTGTGQILAAGTATQAQVLSGVNLPAGSSLVNGDTANPTLTIGNVRVGDTNISYQVANNNTGGPAIRGAIQTGTPAPGANITDGRLSGSGVTAGNFGAIAPGNASTFSVTFNAASAGLLSPLTGQVVRIANNFDNVAEQNMSIVLGTGAAAYNPAVGSVVSPVTVANQRVGGNNTTALTISNTAPAGSYTEVLNASFGAVIEGVVSTNGAQITGGLGTGGVAVGTPDTTTMRVGIDTGTAGAKSGTVTLNYQTNGLGTSGLGIADVGSQPVTVTGNVYQVAQPTFTATTINLGNVHVGGTATQALALTNTNLAPGFQEGLNASFSGSTTGVTTSGGPVTNLAAGASSNALVVGIATAAAGNVNGTATVALASNGTVSGLSDLPLPSQNISVSGNVIAFANPQLTGTLNFGAVAVNSGAVQRTLAVSNVLTAPDAAFQEGLNATFGTLTNTGVGSYGTSGAVTGLLAGATDTTSMVVTFTPGGTAGAISGNVQIQLVSDGTSFGLGTTDLGTQPVTFTGEVTGILFNPAQGQATPTTVAFGNVRINTAQNQTLTVSNIAPAGAFTEGLNANFGLNTGAATNNGGTIASLAGGAANSSAMVVGLNTTAAGAQSGTATVNFLTDGSISQTPPSSVGSQTINVSGTVFRLATGGASDVNLGNFRVGSAATGALTVTNTAANDGFSERLNASVSGTGGAVTATSGSVSLLTAGSASTAISATIGSGTAGLNTGTVSLAYESDGTGTTGAPAIGVGTQTVTVQATGWNLATGNVTPSAITLGNFHVGGAAPAAQTLSVANTAPAAFSEQLGVQSVGASGGFTATNNLGSARVDGGASANNAVTVGLGSTATAGLNTGTLSIQYLSDGTAPGNSGFAPIATNLQSVDITATGYRLANPVIDNPGAFSFGNVHVGDTVQQALAITNNAANDGYSEKLDASFGGTSDARITTSGSIALLGAGATNASNMVIGVNTANAGSVSGTAAVSFASNGSDTSGLGLTGLPAQNVTVSATIEGGVYRLANPVIQTAQPVDFGNVRLGTMLTAQALAIKNEVPNDGFSEKLNASANGTTGGVTASGAFALLAPQGVNGTDILVGLDTSVAGNRSGVATITFVSDGTGTSGLGQTPLASQDVQVTGNVYRLANPTLNTPAVTIAARVGDTSPSKGISLTNSSPDIYTEGLKAGVSTASAGFTTSGSIGNLTAGATDSSTLRVGLATGTAGTFSGTATLTLASTGTGTTGAPDFALADQTVSLTGKVYTAAAASVSPTTLDFGIVHVADVVTQKAIAVTNSAPVTALNDVLKGNFSAPTYGQFTASGNLGDGVAAGAPANTGLKVGVNTATAGIYNSTATLQFQSHNTDMSDLTLANQTVDLVAQVNNYARPVFEQVAGGFSLTQSGSIFTLDFGDLTQGTGIATSSLGVRNDVTGPADLLGGTFILDPSATAFQLTGFTDFAGILAGDLFGGLSVGLDTATLGLFDYSLILQPFGANASGFLGSLGDLTLTLRANVVASTAVPEPSTLLLLGTGLAGLAGWRWRTRGRR